MGLSSTIIYTSELILCSTIHVNMSLFHNMFKRDIKASGNQRSTRDVICKIVQFKMADVKNFEANYWLKCTKDPQIWHISCTY